MRRTDLSRKINKSINQIAEGVLVGEVFDLQSIVSIVKNEIDLKASKEINISDCSVVNFKDSEYEGALKKTDIYNCDSSAKENGIKDIKIISGIVQIKYYGDKVEINLIVESEYTDNEGRNHKLYPNIKSESVTLVNNTLPEEDGNDTENTIQENQQIDILDSEDNENDTANTVEEDEENDINNIISTEDKTEIDYKYYMNEAIVNIFKDRFFGTEPSEELKEIIVTKVHNIYVVNYLKELYKNDSINDSTNEGIITIKRIIDTL